MSLAVVAEALRPQYLSVPEFSRAHTLGPQFGDVASMAGFVPDPEQQLILDAACAFDPVTRRKRAFLVVVVAPRQNLKTGTFKQLALGDLFVMHEPFVPWTAHEFPTSQGAANDLERLIEECPELRAEVKLTPRGEVMKHGAVPTIETVHGAQMVFRTRTKGTGRGLSGSKLFLDEGYAVEAAQVGAVTPILLAQPDPQIRIGSSACRPESAYLASLIEHGRWSAGEQAAGRAGDQRLVYVEYCAPDPVLVCALGEQCDHARGRQGCACDNLDVIRTFHTAITRGRVLEQTVLDLRNLTMPPPEYAREIMGWHDAVKADADDERPFRNPEWPELDTEADEAPACTTFGVEMDIDKAQTSIVAAGVMPDGRGYVEHLERAKGKRWVHGYLTALQTRLGTRIKLAIDSGGPASGQIEDLEGDFDVVPLSTSDVAQAVDDFIDRLPDLEVRWPSYELEAGVEGARTRPMGERGSTIGRRTSADDVAPVLAGIFARWAIDKGTGPSLW